MDVISEVAVQRGDSLLIGRSALRDGMGEIINYPGVTGSITCQSAGDCAAAAGVGIYQFSNDEISGKNWPPEIVWTP